MPVTELIATHNTQWSRALALRDRDDAQARAANEEPAQRAEDEAFAALNAALATPPAEVGLSGARALLGFVVSEAEDDLELSPAGLAALRLAAEALRLLAA